MAGRLRKTAVLVMCLAAGAAGISGRAETPGPGSNAKARAEAARKVYETLLERYRRDGGFQLDPEKLYLWSRRWMEAEREVGTERAERVATVEKHLERMKKWEQMVEAARRQGLTFTEGDVAAAQFYRLEAEAWLAQEKAREGGRP
jgi:hypothetical protein